MIGFGVPWIALGPDRLWSDSGFLCIYEPLMHMFQQHGVRSLIYLPPSFRTEFEKNNDVEFSGVQPVYAEEEPSPSWRYLHAVDQVNADRYLLDQLCPVDFILSNKIHVIPHLAAQAVDHRLVTNIPLVYICLNAGKDAVINPLSKAGKTVGAKSAFHLYAEAASYLMADHVVWTTKDQYNRGMRIARRFLSPTEVQNLRLKHSIIGCGIADVLKGHERTDDEIRNVLQSRKGDDFAVTFLGRMSANKNVRFILDVIQPLFVLHGIKLKIRATKGLPKATKRLFSDADIETVVENMGGSIASREDYAGKLLPSIDCLMYASICEGYCIVPREAVYIGVPVLLPNRAWARTAMGPDYPFYYNDEVEAIALIKRVRDGRITDEEADRFLAARARPESCNFVSEGADKLYEVVRGLVDDRMAVQWRRSRSKIVAAFEEETTVDEEFDFEDLLGRLNKHICVKIGRNIGQQRACSAEDIFHFLRDRLVSLSPRDGRFKRTL